MSEKPDIALNEFPQKDIYTIEFSTLQAKHKNGPQCTNDHTPTFLALGEWLLDKRKVWRAPLRKVHTYGARHTSRGLKQRDDLSMKGERLDSIF